jgi:hypothetical protein
MGLDKTGMVLDEFIDSFFNIHRAHFLIRKVGYHARFSYPKMATHTYFISRLDKKQGTNMYGSVSYCDTLFSQLAKDYRVLQHLEVYTIHSSTVIHIWAKTLRFSQFLSYKKYKSTV